MPQENVMTQEGYNKLKRERDELIARRPEIAQMLNEARSYGDLSENAEYDAAKEEQANLEARILVLDEKLRNAKIIKDEELSLDKVNIGLTVKVRDVKTKEEKVYCIVDATETDPFATPARISVESPIGAALIGHKTKEKVEVILPKGGQKKFEILKIMKTE